MTAGAVRLHRDVEPYEERATMAQQKSIAFFPAGAFGPARNSIGIAQACRAVARRVVASAGLIVDQEFRSSSLPERSKLFSKLACIG